MNRYKIISSQSVRKYVVDETYSSKMLLDDFVAGKKTVQINEGTVAPGAKLGGVVHREDEIYFFVRGVGELQLDEDVAEVSQGDLVFIPAGTFHALSNASASEELVVLTIWREPADNEVYNKRIEEWGTSFMLEQ